MFSTPYIITGRRVKPVLVASKAWKGKFTPIIEREIKEYVVPERPKKRDRLYLWGRALDGALGADRFVRPDGPRQKPVELCAYPFKCQFSETHTIRDVACGVGFTIVAATHDRGEHSYKLFGTGNNLDSQIGLQKATKTSYMGLLTEFCPIDVPVLKGIAVRRVAAGRSHSIVITKCGQAFSFGNNAHGQCGRMIDPSEEYFGRNLIKKVQIPEKVVYAVCGLDHTLFLTKKGQVYSCGWGADGQTGLGNFDKTGVPQLVAGDIAGENIRDISTSGDSVLAVNDKGDMFGWGNNEYGQLLGRTRELQSHTPLRIPLDKKIKNVAAGGSSCVVLDADGEVFSWGFGILGVGPKVELSRTPVNIPATIFGRNETNRDCGVASIAGGLNGFAAINSCGDLFTWGRNQYGCLGIGHDRPQMFPMRVSLTADIRRVSIGPYHMGIVSRTRC